MFFRNILIDATIPTIYTAIGVINISGEAIKMRRSFATRPYIHSSKDCAIFSHPLLKPCQWERTKLGFEPTFYMSSH